MNYNAAIQAVRDLHEEREGVAYQICGHCTDLLSLGHPDPYIEVQWPCATINRMEAALEQ
jgi:hypothetical protein